MKTWKIWWEKQQTNEKESETETNMWRNIYDTSDSLSVKTETLFKLWTETADTSQRPRNHVTSDEKLKGDC